MAYLQALGRLAQLGEHQLDKLGVTGSSPVPPIGCCRYDNNPNSLGIAHRSRSDPGWERIGRSRLEEGERRAGHWAALGYRVMR